LLLHHFFCFPSTLSPHYERLALYTSTMNDERRVSLSLSPSCPFVSYHDQHLPFCTTAPFFLVNRMG
jgi:hypothetical protein